MNFAWDTILQFLSLTFICAGLGIDNGLLIEFSLKTLGLSESTHLRWRSVALTIGALIRIVFLFLLTRLAFLSGPLPAWSWLPNRWFSEHPDDLTWMHLVLFVGGMIIIAMAVWEYYHKLREARHGHGCEQAGACRATTLRILGVITYLGAMNVLFSIDSVFTAVAMMDIETAFWWMVTAVLLGALIMIFGMIPISAIIARNPHVSILMLTILAVIASKLLADGTGAHFSNGLLMFIIAMLLINDAAQALVDQAYAKRSTTEL